MLGFWQILQGDCFFGKHRATRSRPAPLLSVSGSARLALWRIVDKNINYRCLQTHFETFPPPAPLSDFIHGPRRPLAKLYDVLRGVYAYDSSTYDCGT